MSGLDDALKGEAYNRHRGAIIALVNSAGIGPMWARVYAAQRAAYQLGLRLHPTPPDKPPAEVKWIEERIGETLENSRILGGHLKRDRHGRKIE